MWATKRENVGLACLRSVDAIDGLHPEFDLKSGDFQAPFEVPVLLTGHGVGGFLRCRRARNGCRGGRGRHLQRTTFRRT